LLMEQWLLRGEVVPWDAPKAVSGEARGRHQAAKPG